MNTRSAVKIEKTGYAGWSNCYRVANAEVELIVTTDVGPRVIRYGFTGGRNMFKEFEEQLGKSGEREWQPRGGHRLWFAPEHPKLTYALDNGPVQATVKDDVIELTQPVEPETGLEKRITIKLDRSGSRVELIHRITNTGDTLSQFAPWALTMMAAGGVGITGFPPRGMHPEVLAPTNPLVMWAYTDFSDPRWTFTAKHLVLRMDPSNPVPQKAGIFNARTFGAYLLGSDLYIKETTVDPAKPYPDFGCSYETFTNHQFLEMETLGPLLPVARGESIEHAERWSLHGNVSLPSLTDAGIDSVLLPLLNR